MGACLSWLFSLRGEGTWRRGERTKGVPWCVWTGITAAQLLGLRCKARSDARKYVLWRKGVARREGAIRPSTPGTNCERSNGSRWTEGRKEGSYLKKTSPLCGDYRECLQGTGKDEEAFGKGREVRLSHPLGKR